MAKNVFEATMHELMKRSNFQNISEEDELDITTEPVEDDALTDTQTSADVINQETTSENTNDFIGRTIVDCNLCRIPFFIDNNNLEGVSCPSCMATEEDLVIKGEICPIGTLDKVDSEDTNTELDSEIDDDKLNSKSKNESTRVSSLRRKSIQFNEDAMQKIVMNFLTENYKGAKSYRINEARITKSKKLNISGILEFKSGKTTEMNFLTEVVNLRENKDSSFKVKACCPIFSRANSFVLESTMKEGVLTPVSLSYKFVTRSNNRSYSVTGTSTVRQAT